MKRVLAAILVPVAMLTLASCSDDDDGGVESTQTTLTKAQYTEQANAACQKVTDDLAAVFETGFPTVRSQVPAFLPKISPAVITGMNTLRNLEAPASEAAKVQKLRDAASAQVTRYTEATTDPAAAVELFNAEGNWDDLRSAAKEYGGLPACEAIDDEDEGEGEGPTPAPDPATFSTEKKAYVDKINAICASYDERNSEIEAEVFGGGFPPDTAQWKAGLPLFREVVQAQLAEIRKVTPPAADRATVNELVALQEEVLTGLADASAAANSGDDAKLSSVLSVLFPKFDEIDAQLTEYGFTGCVDNESDDSGEGEGEGNGGTAGEG